MNTRLALILSAVLASFNLYAAEFYISPVGQDDPGCTKGSRELPWRSVDDQRHCITAGSTIYFMQGDYYSTAGYPFDLGDGKIILNGTADNPITLAKDPYSNEAFPAKFYGGFTIQSEHLTIDGIEFIRPELQPNKNIIVIGESQHVTIKNSLVHGFASHFNLDDFDPKSDCIKIAGGDSTVEYITIENSKIYNCSEDAIDVTGRKHISYLNNEIYNSGIMQIKGGSEHVLVKGNTLYNMYYGITGNGMDCTKDQTPQYCGSPDLPNMPVKYRFQAKDITIEDNHIHDTKQYAIKASGWRDAIIKNNTFENIALDDTIRKDTSSGTIYPECDVDAHECGYYIEFRENVRSAFFDAAAIDYCQLPENADDCNRPCTSTGGTCVYIRLRANNVSIVDNTFIHDVNYVNNEIPSSKLKPLWFESDAVMRVDNISLVGNTYTTNSGYLPIFSTRKSKFDGASETASHSESEISIQDGSKLCAFRILQPEIMQTVWNSLLF